MYIYIYIYGSPLKFWDKIFLAKKNPRKSHGFFQRSLTFPLFYGHLDQNVLKTGEMLKMFDLIFQKVLKIGEMLKMLKMLKFFGEPQDAYSNI